MRIGDFVKADREMRGVNRSAMVAALETSGGRESIVVRYDDNGSLETLAPQYVWLVARGWNGNASGSAAVHVCRIGNALVAIPTTAPRFIIIGAQKAGTTSLSKYLDQHPNVLPGNRFEPHFFDFRVPGGVKRVSFTDDAEYYCFIRRQYATTMFKYDTLLAAANDGNGAGAGASAPISFEKTPAYITYAEKFPRLFRKVLPWMEKVVAILRDPVDRAYSHFNMGYSRKDVNSIPIMFDRAVRSELEKMRSSGLFRHAPRSVHGVTSDCLGARERAEESKTFQRLARGCLARGLYEIQLRQWAKYYPIPGHLLVLNYDEGPGQVYRQVLRHVGLSDSEVPGGYINHFSAKYSAPMLNTTRSLLEAFYGPYNARLANLLGEEW
eukprot:CAMPEP_0113589350 /NCGR_PEP_ID=MMETSP0015_2-20120614/36039_1 /TAXON_ID=2838 /ORGANISM="Odontella" /LENGTH=381 /DNA_ID=CAMNT_0000495359 /DNA_START=287 /DNA_END=1429 /DNA_ORIENTATION=- /assembly_acc=CAM_ASM_000160